MQLKSIFEAVSLHFIAVLRIFRQTLCLSLSSSEIQGPAPAIPPAMTIVSYQGQEILIAVVTISKETRSEIATIHILPRFVYFSRKLLITMLKNYGEMLLCNKAKRSETK